MTRRKSQRVANTVCFSFHSQASSASWSFVNSSSTFRRWWRWGIAPASRWSSLPQSECLDCPSCPVGGRRGRLETMVGKSCVLLGLHQSIFTHQAARWREGGAINHFSVVRNKKAPLALNGSGYSSVLMERFLSRWQIQQAGSRWEEMKSQVLLVMQTGCSQVAAHCW